MYGGSGGKAACVVSTQQEWVLESTRDWYYFDELLPAIVVLELFQPAAELLYEMTATASEQAHCPAVRGICPQTKRGTAAM